MKRLPNTLFSEIVANTPLVSIDLFIKNNDGQILLGKRINRPALGMWFVPGGRICKGEMISEAFLRLTREELGVALSQEQSKPLGIFEHFYPDNFSGEEFSTHYVVLAYQLTLDLLLERMPQEQHDIYRWWEEKELLNSAEVHPHCKLYL